MQILGIKWSDQVRNEDALQLAAVDRTIIKSIKSRKLKWIGHVLRHIGMFRDATEGKLLEKRSKERRRYKMLDDLI